MEGRSNLIDVLKGGAPAVPPIWMMRQAGRYLPEYREIRERAGSFLTLCYTPELAAEVTLQPLRRFDFDAAILFSDILVVAQALGQGLSFEANEGPRLTPPIGPENLSTLAKELDQELVGKVYETVKRVKMLLAPSVSLLGFCGAPWTVATYMVAGCGTPDQAPARLFAYQDAEGFSRLIERLTDASVEYLAGQFAAGVDAVQIFDTWSGTLPGPEFEKWCIKPMQEIVSKLRARQPGAKIIGFPRGAGTNLENYVVSVPVDAVGLDWMIDRNYARERIQSRVAVQGNLDPLVLLAGGAALDRAVDQVLSAFADRPFIFNLGHGILPQTPIAHVERMVNRVRGKGR